MAVDHMWGMETYFLLTSIGSVQDVERQSINVDSVVRNALRKQRKIGQVFIKAGIQWCWAVRVQLLKSALNVRHCF